MNDSENPYFFRLAIKQPDCFVENGGIQQKVEAGEKVGACSFCIVDENGVLRECNANNFRVECNVETGESERIVWEGDCLYRVLSDELLE